MPGAKRPPPMASRFEEETPLGCEMGRLELERGGAELGVLGVGLCGAKVSPSIPRPPPTIVAPASWLTPEPQEEQNLAVSGIAEPHCEQNMGPRFYHRSNFKIL